MELSEVKLVVRGLLMSAQNGLSVRQLMKDFADEEGTPIPFKELGFTNPIAFLLSIPDVVRFHTGSPDINCMAYPVASDNNRHIAELVAGQTSKKRTRSKSLRRPVSRPGYNRSYGTHPSKDYYSSYNNSSESRFPPSWQKEYVSNFSKTNSYSTQRERTSRDYETSKYQDKENSQNNNARSYPTRSRSSPNRTPPNRDDYYHQQYEDNNEPHEKGKAGPTPSENDACKEKSMSYDSTNKPSANFPRSHDTNVPISSASQSNTNESRPALSISNISPSVPKPVAKFIAKFSNTSQGPPPLDKANSNMETTSKYSSEANLPNPVPPKDPPVKLPPYIQSVTSAPNVSPGLQSTYPSSQGQTMSHMSQASQQPSSHTNRSHLYITTTPRPGMNQPVNCFMNQPRPLLSLPYCMPQGIDSAMYLNLLNQKSKNIQESHLEYVGAPQVQYFHQPSHLNYQQTPPTSHLNYQQTSTS
uniref:Tudor domain-containing protein 7 n=1 Tax=Cacopsylla melanoneura TaxID=428564 RepID=A0A8D8M0A5_9HEMI